MAYIRGRLTGLVCQCTTAIARWLGTVTDSLLCCCGDTTRWLVPQERLRTTGAARISRISTEARLRAPVSNTYASFLWDRNAWAKHPFTLDSTYTVLELPMIIMARPIFCPKGFGLLQVHLNPVAWLPLVGAQGALSLG